MKESREITNNEDLIDSRDIIARIEYLESEKEDCEDKNNFEFEEELTNLINLAEEGENYCNGDWQFGSLLVRDSYFEDFAIQEAEDLGLIQNDAQWPYTCIDWEKAAEELQMDYTAIDFDGVTYWIR